MMIRSRLAVAALLSAASLALADSLPAPAVLAEHSTPANAVVAAAESAVRLTAAESGNASLRFTPAEGVWDFSSDAQINIEVTNPGTRAVLVRGRVENAGSEGLFDSSSNAIEVPAGATGTLTVRLVRRPEDPGYAVFEPFYMYFKEITVRDNSVDPAAIAAIIVSIDHAVAGDTIEIRSIAPSGSGTPAPVPFFPFIDQYGQYIHSDWPGKIYSDADFAREREKEAAELTTAAPAGWSKYGGWADGPKLEATGSFRVTKYEGRWWLVDPDGYLFWSNGPTGVGFGGDITPITDREHWFAGLPPRDSELGQFYRTGRGATYRYYSNKSWEGIDIQQANLFRKYGPDYRQIVTRISHDRMRSWGFNTMANWSDPTVYLAGGTPYTVAVHYGAPAIHYRMPDVYHPDWEPNMREAVRRAAEKTANDPYNIGYFIDNERWFGWRPRAAAITEEVFKNPPETHAKIKLVDVLKAKYDSIDKLNEAWGTEYASWDALLESKTVPDFRNEKVLSDAGDFGMMFAEKYFEACDRAIRDFAPNKMYLGSRFHGHIDGAVFELAAKYADVVSYNVYDNPPDGRVNQYNRYDKPIMSTEWGIGSDPQQTPFHGRNAPTPAQRAASVAQYLNRAIRHPNIVGAHFFQYRDQPTSGRPDGEATLRGFVNVADTPNFELVQTNRRFARTMYEVRAGRRD